MSAHKVMHAAQCSPGFLAAQSAQGQSEPQVVSEATPQHRVAWATCQGLERRLAERGACLQPLHRPLVMVPPHPWGCAPGEPQLERSSFSFSAKPGAGSMKGSKEAAAAPCPAGFPEAEEDQESLDENSDSDLETGGTQGLGELEDVKDTLYLSSCSARGVVPISCFLRHRNSTELNLRHRGLGPQGAWALASALAFDVHIKHLDLRDNELREAGVQALTTFLSRSRTLCDVDLSENQLGAPGAQILCTALAASSSIWKAQLAGNRLGEQAAQCLAELLLAHTCLKCLDLSYNQLNDRAGEILGPALAENTGLTELNISWNHLRGPGVVTFAKGLEANIFLKILDISYNGFGDSGAAAVGEALKTNNVLEELNMSNNRISVKGAMSLGLGLRTNQTLRILKVSRNPMQSEGCFGILKSVQKNLMSALELLDFSNIQVSKEFDDLAITVKAILPGLCIKTAAHRV